MQRWQFRGDVAAAKGSAAKRVLYAFTSGMLPWEKESGWLHWVAYLRGVTFRAGIFLGVAFLNLHSVADLSVFRSEVCGIGALGYSYRWALAGFWLRFRDPMVRAVSIADDYLALALASGIPHLGEPLRC